MFPFGCLVKFCKNKKSYGNIFPVQTRFMEDLTFVLSCPINRCLS